MTTLDRAAVDALLARARREIDDGRSNLRGMGRAVSPRAFGHNGAAGQIAWADPATGLSFCYLLREPRRTTAMASYAAVCAV